MCSDSSISATHVTEVHYSGFEMPDDDLTERKEALLQREGLTLHEHSVRRGPLSARLLATLRISLCNATELASFEEGATKPFEAASKRLEKEIHTTLKVTIESLLAELAQAGESDDEPMLERDEEVLEESDDGRKERDGDADADGEVTETRRLALAYKARYAEVLNSALQQANDALTKLQ